MRVSLVLGTLGTRNDLLRVFLDSLTASLYRDFELIVVDQSRDSGVSRLLEGFRAPFPVVRLTSAPGLSRARNVGLARITGDIAAFPDDDCRYPEGLLGSVVNRFHADPTLAGLAGRPVDSEGNSAFPRWDLRAGAITKFNVWRRSNSNALFLRRAVIDKVGEFDESLGLGSGTPWGAAEDVDYPLRVLSAGFKLHYDPEVEVQHPISLQTFDAAGRARAVSYGAGAGRVLRKHRYPLWFVLYQAVRPLGGVLISASTGRPAKARYHAAVLRGRVNGWLSPVQYSKAHR